MVAVKMATITHGGDRKSKDQDANLRLDRKSLDEVSELFNISPRTISDARAVQNSGNQDLIDAVSSGKVKVSKAANDIRASTPRPALRRHQVKAGACIGCPVLLRRLRRINHSRAGGCPTSFTP
jgi:hypothetical protein